MAMPWPDNQDGWEHRPKGTEGVSTTQLLFFWKIFLLICNYITTMAEYFCLLASLGQVFSISLNIA
jgi:hypothetical protein